MGGSQYTLRQIDLAGVGLEIGPLYSPVVSKNDVVLDAPSGYAEFINTIKCKKKYAAEINKDCRKYTGKYLSQTTPYV